MKFFHISLLFLSFVLFFIITTSCCNDSHNDFFKCFSGTSASLIYTQTNSSFQEVWLSGMHNRRPVFDLRLKPIAIITPVKESQISVIISCSKLYGMEIRTRSGGHDYEGLASVSDSPFILLDMSNFRSIAIDPEKKTVWAQTGVTLGELYYAIAKTSRTLAFPAGVCPTVCVGGHVSGGGFGMISRKFGLAIDHVIDVRIVDVNGRVLDRESMGEDFFWAIRGGGGASFGVILAFKLNLVSIPRIVTVFNIARMSDQNLLVQRHMHIADKMDNNLVLRLFAKSIDDNEKGKTIRVVFNAVYLGGVEKLLQVMHKDFPELGLAREDCTEMSWIDSVVYNWHFPRDSAPEVLLNRKKESTTFIYKGKSDFLTEPIPEAGLSGLWKRLHEKTGEFEMQITPFGGRMNEISESELPFPHRLGTRHMIHYLLKWNDQDKNAKDENSTDALTNVKWLRELYKYMGSYVSKNPRTAYHNYRDLDLGSDDGENARNTTASIWGIKYFKNNFERLVQVKAKVDPTNFFKNKQSIPVSHHFDTKDIRKVTEKKTCDIKLEL